MSLILYDKFYDKFVPYLNTSKRWPSFCVVAKHLFSLDRPVCIVETGCLREKGNWLGDGQSSKLWEYIAVETGGKAVGIDLSRNATEIAKANCPGMKFITGDSIKTLANANDVEKIDLLYLDSYDYEPPYPLSQLHHVGELAAVWARLPFGCLVAVDDCRSDREGKHIYVERFMDDMSIPMMSDGYVRVWMKTEPPAECDRIDVCRNDEND